MSADNPFNSAGTALSLVTCNSYIIFNCKYQKVSFYNRYISIPTCESLFQNKCHVENIVVWLYLATISGAGKTVTE